MIIVNFIRDKEVGIFARAKRLSKDKSKKMEVGLSSDNGNDSSGSCANGYSTDESTSDSTRKRKVYI